MVGGFASSYEAKSASTSEAPSPSHSERAACAFNYIQLQRLEWSVASRLPTRQKAPLRQKLHPPPILNEPLALLIISSSSG
ncbi:hypothetical protein COL77_03200 [Bacillus wiedmannii]|nr:hypothetical protein COL77_03200 [Bacillus wiedmannii]PGA81730.1 hypothetical protein COL94_23715 [Bacillus wiedmannii]PHF57863.1 hypothetical protein COI40_22095 [Bacillus wiedmannii]